MSLIERASDFYQSDRGRRIFKWVRRGFYLVVAAILIGQLTKIGWMEIGRSLPSHPLFYIIFAVMYVSLPATETLIYSLSWKFGMGEGIIAFLKKRVYNKEVLGYSGEVYLCLWAEKRLGRPRREVVGVIKDNNIVSSIASTLFGVSVLAVLVAAGQIVIPARFLEWDGMVIVAAVIVALVAAALGVRFRRSIFWLSGRVLATLLFIHLARLILVNVLQLLQWSVVLPEVSLNAWLTLIALLIITSRIPLLPARELIFIGAGLELSEAVGMPVAGLAGMLLVASVMDKTLNLLLFSLATLSERHSKLRLAEAETRARDVAMEDPAETSALI
jgi:hypothetical protein